MSELTVSALKTAVKELEDHLTDEIARRVTAFQKSTGLEVISVSVDVLPLEGVGVSSVGIVNGVEVSVALGRRM